MNRRTFLKTADAVAAGTLLAGNQANAQSETWSSETMKDAGIKNILLLFVDQHRQDCIGCYGNPIVQTPHIDRLAHNGIRFTNAYTPAPVCSPARASLQTGLWPHHHRLIFNTGNARWKGGQDDPDPSTKFFSEDLRKEGWQLSHIGKWHIGTPKHKPSAHGYDDTIYYPGYGVPSNYYSYYRIGSKPHPHYLEYLKKQGVDGFRILKKVKEGGTFFSGLQEGSQSATVPAYLAEQTIDVINRYSKSDRPFFISCHFWGPHAPYCISEKFYNMYRDSDIKPWPNFDIDLSDKPQVFRRYADYVQTDYFTNETLPELIGHYYGYISLIDDEIGRILKTLEEAGELENTLIIYSADHGSSVGSYRMWDKGYGMYDNITRIPLIFSHPSIKPGVSEAFVTLCDLAPTFIDLAGCVVPDEMDGSTLIPIIRGEQASIREDYIVTEHHGHHCPFPQRMVRTNNFKYIFNPTSVLEFYDLETDPYETKNIINTVDRSKMKQCEEILIQWMRDTNDIYLNWAENCLVDGVVPY